MGLTQREEMERLYDSVSQYKKDLGRMVSLANKWKLRAQVAEALAEYLNSIHMPGSKFFDVQEEIAAQVKSLEKQREMIFK